MSLRWIEMTAVFGALPVVLMLSFEQVPIILPLLVAAAACLVILTRDRDFDQQRLWRFAALRQALPGIVFRWIIGAALLVLLLGVLTPQDLFNFPRRDPRTWLLVVLLYPLLSAWPQEVIFRAFFLHRYRRLLGAAVLVTSALAFAWAHVLFRNWLAVVLTLPAGLLFASTYRRHRSLACSTVEHALWGDLVFTIGLGRYFYSGA